LQEERNLGGPGCRFKMEGRGSPPVFLFSSDCVRWFSTGSRVERQVFLRVCFDSIVDGRKKAETVLALYIYIYTHTNNYACASQREKILLASLLSVLVVPSPCCPQLPDLIVVLVVAAPPELCPPSYAPPEPHHHCPGLTVVSRTLPSQVALPSNRACSTATLPVVICTSPVSSSNLSTAMSSTPP
jgi:hypothetical protein